MDGGDKPKKRGESLTAYATLVRLPNLFTAPPDPILGAAFSIGVGYTVSTGAVVGLAAASVLLYAAGTTLNDYFDAVEDARERPERPIPTGAVSRERAFVFGVALLGSGVMLALVTAGTLAGVVAGGLALVIVLYDGVFKGSVVGFLFMGGSRGLNVFLGTTAAVSFPVLSPQIFVVIAIVLFYIAAVTYMAESETKGNNRNAVLVAIASMGVAALGVVGFVVVRSPPLFETILTATLLIGFFGWTGRALSRAYTDPVPETIGPAVGTCVLGLVVLNAAFAATIGVAWALSILVFLVPAISLARMFDIT